MSADTTSSQPDLFKRGVIILLTLVSVFAALVTFLQNYASLRSADLAQQSSFAAVNSSGLYFRAGLEAAQGTDALQRYEDDIQRSVRADTKARALRMGGNPALAGEYDLDARRWQQAANEVAASDPLLAEFGRDEALYLETLWREAYTDEEREHTLLEQSRAWSNKANRYVALLSTLSVALFLAGLSLTISSRIRYLLAAAGVGLTAICGLGLLFTLFSSVAEVPAAAIQYFVEGRIKYNLSRARGENATDAVSDFDAAIELAPLYARAYFYRSLANTDSSLIDKHLDTQKAIDDGVRAAALGHEGSPVHGNLGWLYYLNGQYNSALASTEIALAMSPDECYLPFNHGLILMALQRVEEADAAYAQAMDCAQRQSSDYQFNYHMDVGVADLEDLATARPDLAPSLEPAIQRLKEGLASLRMFGELRQRDISATFEPLVFGAALDSDGIVMDVAEEFPQTATIIYAQLEYQKMSPDSRWMARWLVDGREYLTTVYETWDYGESGTAWVNIYNNAGLNSGNYVLDVFVEGRLVASGRLVVQPGELPPMTSYSSSNVGVTISYPLDWNVTDLADNEVSVVAARDPNNPNFFGVTSFVATTGTDDDIFQLFQLYVDGLDQAFDDVTSEEAEAFTVAGREGWLDYYTYTDRQGTPIQGALAGVLDSQKQYTYVLVIESHTDDWDGRLNLFNVMLGRMTIDE